MDQQPTASAPIVRGSIYSLPVELLQQILEVASCEATSRKVLRMAKVSRFFYETLLPRLYTTVALDSGKQAELYLACTRRSDYAVTAMTVGFWEEDVDIGFLILRLFDSLQPHTLKALTVTCDAVEEQLFSDVYLHHPHVLSVESLSLCGQTRVSTVACKLPLKSLLFSEDAYLELDDLTILMIIEKCVKPNSGFHRLDIGGISLARYYDEDSAKGDLEYLDTLMRAVKSLTLPSIDHSFKTFPQPFYHFIELATSLSHLTLLFNAYTTPETLYSYLYGCLKAASSSFVTLTLRVLINPDLKLDANFVKFVMESMDLPVLEKVKKIEVIGLRGFEIDSVDGGRELRERCQEEGIWLLGV